MSKLVDSWNPDCWLLSPMMYRCPIPLMPPLISALPSKPCMQAVLCLACVRYCPKSCDNRLVDAPVSTIASPKMHSVAEWSDDALHVFLVCSRVLALCFGPWHGVTTIAMLFIRPVGNNKFPTVGS